MKTNFKKVLASAAVIAVMAAPAFAGSISYYATGAVNVPANIALEAMGAARNFRLTGDVTANNSANAALLTTTTTNLISGDMLTVSFTNAGFDGSPVVICKSTANVVANTAIATDTPSANATSFAFRITANVTANDGMFVTNHSDGTNCNVSNKSLQLKMQPLSSAAMASVSVSGATSGGSGIAGANATAVNFANISRQYSTVYGQGNSTIDYITNSTSNGARFLGAANNAAVAGTANISNAANVGLTAPGSGLTVSALLSLQDSATWQGVQRVYVATGTCTLSANNAVNNAPSGTVNLAIPSAVFDGNAASGVLTANVCVDVKGNAALQTRNIKAGYDISVTGTGAVDPAADALTTIMSWTPNGYQGVIPYISASSTYKTICILSNKSTASAGVTLDVLTSESGASLTNLSGLSVGSIAALGTIRVDLDSVITPYSYSSGTETAGTTTTLTGLQASDRYSALINVGANPTQVTVNCMQVDPAGSKRAVPVLTQIGTTYWQQ